GCRDDARRPARLLGQHHELRLREGCLRSGSLESFTLPRGDPMNRRRDVYVGVSVITLVVVLIAVQLMLQTRAEAQGTQAGVYESSPFWPKPLPNHWVFGSVVGLAVDSRDHIWVVHRGKATIDPNLGAM